MTSSQTKRACWTTNEWSALTSLSNAYVRELIADGTIRTCKIGCARRILTDPFEFAEKREEKKGIAKQQSAAPLDLDLAL